MPRQIKQTYRIQSNIETVFDALLSPSQICTWWFAKTAIVVPKVNGIYAITWGEDMDDPDYISIAVITELARPNCLVLSDFRYHSKEGGLPFDANFGNEFLLEKESNGTAITVIQSGFPDESVADEFYLACNQGWQDTMKSLKMTLEKGG